MKRLIAFLLGFMILLTACGSSAETVSGYTMAEVTLLEENIPDDNYGNYYEIFVYSFCDSDGDGIGDFNGVTSKLDYIRDLGYTGIWFMPITEGYSYHKYDVTDYYNVDSQFGTMEDFENLVEEAHARGIKIIIDLVVNHTSSEHPWFKSAIQSAWDGDTEGEYYDYYNFSDTALDGYSYYDGIYYEARFTYSMPDLNLDSENVRAEIEIIIEFWIGKGVDGFRLDACTSFYTGDYNKSTEFCAWLTDVAQEYNPDAFVVGEVWESDSIVKTYYEIAPETSFFAFSVSQQEGYVNMTFSNAYPANYFWSYANTVYKTANSGESIAAPFLDNHDTGRIAGSVGRDENKVKFAYGMLSLLNGTTFTYYGDEIGMVGSGDDPNKRIAMLWDNSGENLTDNPPGTTSASYAFDGVEEQYADETSILNYYKRCNNIRNAFPEIARGEMKMTYYSDMDVLIFSKTWEDSTITIVVNFSTEEKTVEMDLGELQAELAVEGNATYEDGVLTLPMYSFAIFK